jgi:hypothetical protein
MRTSAALLAALAVSGCRSSKSHPAAADASHAVAATASDPLGAPARFSRPLAAVRGSRGGTFVAGLVVPRSAVALSSIGADGATRWTRDVITGVVWSANATLNVFGAKAGAVVVWRGLRAGQEVTLAALVDADGKVDGEPFPVGAATCATDAELAWIDHAPSGSWVVNRQAFGTHAPVSALTLPEDRDPAILCGPHRIFALGDGEYDVTLNTWGEGARSSPLRVIAETDFRGDEERGHEAYGVGDVLGLVRIGVAGSVASREVASDHASPWRRLGRKLTEGDDVTLVDADVHNAVLAFTRDTSSGADVAGASGVRALVWERGGTRDVNYELAAPDRARARGPFWSGAVSGGVVIAWVERSARADAGEAPILGMTYRLVSIDALGESHRVVRPADDLVDAGCDDTRCYAVALARASNEDGGQPELAEVIAYP